jgi:flagellar motor switch protein FliM
VSGRPEGVRSYDFRRPDKFNKDQLRTLSAIHESIGRLMGVRLSGRLRLATTVEASSVEQTLFGEHLESLDLPAQLAVISFNGSQILMDLPLELCLAAVERQIGGAGQKSPARREPTSVEAELIRRLVEDLVPALNEAWSQLAKVDAKVVEMALTPALLRVAAPSAATAVVRFDIEVGGKNYRVNLAYPAEAIAPIAGRLSVSTWYAERSSADAAGWNTQLSSVIGETAIEVRAMIGHAALPIREVASIAIGDVIRLDRPANGPIVIDAAGTVHASAVAGRVGERIAVRLVRPFEPKEA